MLSVGAIQKPQVGKKHNNFHGSKEPKGSTLFVPIFEATLKLKFK